MATTPHDGSPVLALWTEFCRGLEAAGAALESSYYPQDPAGQVDGVRHLATMAMEALHWYLGGADPDFPRFVTLNDTNVLADNRFAAVRGDAVYLLTGNVTGLTDVNVSLHEGWPFLGKTKVWGDIGLDDLDVDDNGNFELVVSATRDARVGERNWLELPPDATFVHVREYFGDWAVDRPGTFEIVRLGSEGRTPGRMTADELARRLDDVLEWVHGYIPGHAPMIDYLRSQPPNIVQPPRRETGGNVNIVYLFGRFELADDQCLLLEFEQPEARMWGIQWLTIPWYDNPDPAERSSSVIDTDAFVNGDGVVRVVVSARDIGAPNWLDTHDYREGILAARWIWIEGTGSAIASEVVPADQLWDRLPADTPRAGAEERAALQARRRTNYARRRR
jgi:hypothetical protein